MVQYCCSSALNSSVSRNPKGNFTWNPEWTVEGACAFNTCKQSNTGNPDLGGIGVSTLHSHNVEWKIMLIILQIIVAYFIEASLLALSLIMFGIKFVTDRVIRKRNKVQREMLEAHEAAVLLSTGVFLDTSVYFALSICFAAIIFNYRDKPLLYEDSMYPQSSSFFSRCMFWVLRHVSGWFATETCFKTGTVLFERLRWLWIPT